MNWEDNHVLMTAMETGGYAGAAERLGVSHGTVRRHVERLAHQLGSALFIHSPEGLTPTPSAVALLPVLERVAGAAAAFTRLASARIDSLEGLVRVVAAPMLALDLLPCLRDAGREHSPKPLVEVGASTGAEWIQLEIGDADVAATTTAPCPDALEGRLAGALGAGLYAHRQLLSAVGSPATICQLSRFPLVGPQGPGYLQGAFAKIGQSVEQLDFVFRSDGPAARLAAIRSGVGMGLFPVHLGRRERELVRVLPELTARYDVWVAIRRDMADVRRIVLVRDALIEHVQALMAEAAAGGVGAP